MRRVQEVINSVENTGDVMQFYNDASEQLNGVIYGEQNAKDAAIGSMVSRKTLMLSGLPGGGKSALAGAMPWLVEGMSDDKIAFVPGQHDLTANQLVGGEVSTTKRISGADGSSSEQRTSTIIDGVFKPTTEFAHLEETSGANPLALRSLLSAVEEHRVENISGRLELPELISIVFSMNPGESSESTFKISDAMAARVVFGAVMGLKGTREQRIDHANGVRELNDRRIAQFGPDSRPRDVIRPVATKAGLLALRDYVLNIPVDGKTRGKITEIGINLADKLEDLRVVRETDGRLSSQVQTNARTFGALRNNDRIIRDVDLRDAARSVLVGRLGALQRTDHLQIEEIVDEIANV